MNYIYISNTIKAKGYFYELLKLLKLLLFYAFIGYKAKKLLYKKKSFYIFVSQFSS